MPETVIQDPLFTPKELCEYLGVTPRWMYERVQAKAIPHARVGKFLRFRKSEIDAYVAALSVKVAPPTPARLPGRRAVAKGGR